MGSTKTDPLSVEDAKKQLRQAVNELGVAAWVKRRPIHALTLSFVAGMVLATSPPLRGTMMRMLVRIL
jgi:hypothetical protein